MNITSDVLTPALLIGGHFYSTLCTNRRTINPLLRSVLSEPNCRAYADLAIGIRWSQGKTYTPPRWIKVLGR